MALTPVAEDYGEDDQVPLTGGAVDSVGPDTVVPEAPKRDCLPLAGANSTDLLHESAFPQEVFVAGCR